MTTNEIRTKFLNFFKSKSITSFDVFGVFLTGFNEFLDENEINPNNMVESITFFKNNENQAKKRNLIGYRLGINISDLTFADSLLVKVNLNPDEKLSLDIIEKFSFFSSRIIMKSYNEFYMIIVGLRYNHYISDIIKDYLVKHKVDFELFTIKSKIYRNIAYNNLYDFKTKKWALSPMKQFLL